MDMDLLEAGMILLLLIYSMSSASASAGETRETLKKFRVEQLPLSKMVGSLSWRRVLMGIAVVSIISLAALAVWYLFTSNSAASAATDLPSASQGILHRFWQFHPATRFALILVSAKILCVVKILLLGLPAYMLFRKAGRVVHVDKFSIDLGSSAPTVQVSASADSFFMRTLYAKSQKLCIKVFAANLLKSAKKDDMEQIVKIEVPDFALGCHSKGVDMTGEHSIGIDISGKLNLTDIYNITKQRTSHFRDFGSFKVPVRVTVSGRIFTPSLGVPIRVPIEKSLEFGGPSSPSAAVQDPKAAEDKTEEAFCGLESITTDAGDSGDGWRLAITAFVDLSRYKIPIDLIIPEISVTASRETANLATLFCRSTTSSEPFRQKIKFGLKAEGQSGDNIADVVRSCASGKTDFGLIIHGSMDGTGQIPRLVRTLKIRESPKKFMEELHRPVCTKTEKKNAALAVEPDQAEAKDDLATASLGLNVLGGGKIQLVVDTVIGKFVTKMLFPTGPSFDIGTFGCAVIDASDQRFDAYAIDASEIQSRKFAHLESSLRIKDGQLANTLAITLENLGELSRIAALYGMVPGGQVLPKDTLRSDRLFIAGIDEKNRFLQKLYNSLIVVVHLGSEGTMISLDRMYRPALPDKTPSVGPLLNENLAPVKNPLLVAHEISVKLVNNSHRLGIDIKFDLSNKDVLAGHRIKFLWQRMSFGVGHPDTGLPVVMMEIPKGSLGATLSSATGIAGRLHSGSAAVSVDLSTRNADDVVHEITSIYKSFTDSKSLINLNLFVNDQKLPFVVPSQELMAADGSLPAAAAAPNASTFAMKRQVFTVMPFSENTLMALYLFAIKVVERQPHYLPIISALNIQVILPKISVGIALAPDGKDAGKEERMLDMANISMEPIRLSGRVEDGQLLALQSSIGENGTGREIERIVLKGFQSKDLHPIPIFLSMPPARLHDILKAPRPVAIKLSAPDDQKVLKNLLKSLVSSLKSLPAATRPAAERPKWNPVPVEARSGVKVDMNMRPDDSFSLQLGIELPSVLTSGPEFAPTLEIRLPESVVSLGAPGHEYVSLRMQETTIPYRIGSLPSVKALATGIYMELVVHPQADDSLKLIHSSSSPLLTMQSLTGEIQKSYKVPIDPSSLEYGAKLLKDLLRDYKVIDLSPKTPNASGGNSANPGGDASTPWIRLSSIEPLANGKLPCPFDGLCPPPESGGDELKPTARVTVDVSKHRMMARMADCFRSALELLNWPTMSGTRYLKVRSDWMLKEKVQVDDSFDAIAVQINPLAWDMEESASGTTGHSLLPIDISCNPGGPQFRTLFSQLRLWPLPVQWPQQFKTPAASSQALGPIALSLHGNSSLLRMANNLLGHIYLKNLLSTGNAGDKKDEAAGYSLTVAEASSSDITFDVDGLEPIAAPVGFSTIAISLAFTDQSGAEKQVAAIRLPMNSTKLPQVTLREGEALGRLVGKLISGAPIEALLSVAFGTSPALSLPLKLSERPSALSTLMMSIYDSWTQLPTKAPVNVPAKPGYMTDPYLYINSVDLYYSQLASIWGAGAAAYNVVAYMTGYPLVVDTECGLRQQYFPEAFKFALNMHNTTLNAIPMSCGYYSPSGAPQAAPAPVGIVMNPAQPGSSKGVPVLFRQRPTDADRARADEEFQKNVGFFGNAQYYASFLSRFGAGQETIEWIVNFLKRCQKGDGSDRSRNKIRFTLSRLFEGLSEAGQEGEACLHLKTGSKLVLGIGDSNDNVPFKLGIDFDQVTYPLQYNYFADPCRIRPYCSHGFDSAGGDLAAVDTQRSWQYRLVMKRLQLEHNFPLSFRIDFKDPAGASYSLLFIPRLPYDHNALDAPGSLPPSGKSGPNEIRMLKNNQIYKVGANGNIVVSRTLGVFPPNALHVGITIVYNHFDKKLYIDTWDAGSDRKGSSSDHLRTTFPIDFGSTFKGPFSIHSGQWVAPNRQNTAWISAEDIEFRIAHPDLARTRVHFDSAAPYRHGTETSTLFLELFDHCDVRFASPSIALQCRLIPAGGDDNDSQKNAIGGAVEFDAATGLYLFRFRAMRRGYLKILLFTAENDKVELLHPKVLII